MTLHLHLSFVSPQPHLFLDRKQAVIYMQILVRKIRRRNAFLLLKNKHSLTILQTSLFSIWLDMAFRETQACCLQSWVEGWQGQWAHCGGWWEGGTRLTLKGWNFAGKGIGEEVQGKINPNCTYTLRSGLLASCERMLLVLFHYMWITNLISLAQGCCRLIYINHITTISNKWNIM